MEMGRVYVGSRVSVSHGNLHIPPANPGGYMIKPKRKLRMRLFCHMEFSVAPNQLKFIWDNGSTKNIHDKDI